MTAFLVIVDAADDDAAAAVCELGARTGISVFPVSDQEERPITTADFTVHLADRRWVRADGVELRLTPTQWKLAEVLLRAAGHLVSQEELLARVWGPRAAGKTDYLRVYMTAIRRKVEPDPAHPRYFITVPGLGLRFEPNAGKHDVS